ncbi:uncharacterized protein LOC130989456 [Salvia miltiorrhiza]|uniref:uncharacterized protein LOC130989456 n=1 Tax=Salvia miltiorrhiza TaxID=226208 RepID=UPI0025AC98F2|nr:uncharacterized protein LOC130989456 [Salvia miltiorrhiza]
MTPDLGLGTMSQMRFSGLTSTHSTSTSQFPSTTFSAQIAQLQAELQQTQQREAALQAEMEERRQREAAIQAELKEWRRRETEMETRQSEMQQQLTRILQFFQSSSRMFNSLDGMSPPPPTPTPVKLESGGEPSFAMEVEGENGSKEM